MSDPARTPERMKLESDILTPDAPPGSAPCSGSATYRLLSNADAICPGDERLCDDCQTWETLEANNPFFGQRYDGNFYVPMRRMSLNEKAERPAGGALPTTLKTL